MEESLSDFLRFAIEEVQENSHVFYLESAPEEMRKAAYPDGDSFVTILSSEEFKKAYFEGSTLSVERIEGNLVSVNADDEETYTFDLKTMSIRETGTQIVDAKMNNGDLILTVKPPFFSSKLIDEYRRIVSLADRFKNLDRNIFNVIVNSGALKGPDLVSVCSVNSRIRNWCDEDFFRRAAMKEFPDRFNYHRPKSYKDFYLNYWIPTYYDGVNMIFYEGYPPLNKVQKIYGAYIKDLPKMIHYIGLTYDGEFMIKSSDYRDLERMVGNGKIKGPRPPPFKGAFAGAKHFEITERGRMAILSKNGDLYYQSTMTEAPIENDLPEAQWVWIASKVKSFKFLNEDSMLFLEKTSLKALNLVDMVETLLLEDVAYFPMHSTHLNFNEKRDLYFMEVYLNLNHQPCLVTFSKEKTITSVVKPSIEDGNKFQLLNVYTVFDKDLNSQDVRRYKGIRVVGLTSSNELKRVTFWPGKNTEMTTEILIDFNNIPQLKGKDVVAITRQDPFERERYNDDSYYVNLEEGNTFVIKGYRNSYVSVLKHRIVFSNWEIISPDLVKLQFM